MVTTEVGADWTALLPTPGLTRLSGARRHHPCGLEASTFTRLTGQKPRPSAAPLEQVGFEPHGTPRLNRQRAVIAKSPDTSEGINPSPTAPIETPARGWFPAGVTSQ